QAARAAAVGGAAQGDVAAQQKPPRHVRAPNHHNPVAAKDLGPQPPWHGVQKCSSGTARGYDGPPVIGRIGPAEVPTRTDDAADAVARAVVRLLGEMATGP